MSVYRKSDGVATRLIAGETLLVPVKGKLADLRKVYVLEGCGPFLWDRIDGRRGVESIAADLVERYEVGPQDADRDARELVAELEKAGLVEMVR